MVIAEIVQLIHLGLGALGQVLAADKQASNSTAVANIRAALPIHDENTALFLAIQAEAARQKAEGNADLVSALQDKVNSLAQL